MPVYKLDEQRIPIFWDLVKPGLILGKNISGVDGDWDFANKVLEQAIMGRCTIWLGFEEGEIKGDNYVGFLITYVAPDRFLRENDLVIYFLYTYRIASPQLRQDAIASLYKYAKHNKCKRVVAYTENKGMEQIIEGTFGPHISKRSLYYVRMEEV